MTNRVYVLLHVREGKADEAFRTLHGKVGVRLLDILEGLPNVIMMLQARDRQRLAKLTIEAVASVEHLTEELQLLPMRDECDAPILTKPFILGKATRKRPGKRNTMEAKKDRNSSVCSSPAVR